MLRCVPPPSSDLGIRAEDVDDGKKKKKRKKDDDGEEAGGSDGEERPAPAKKSPAKKASTSNGVGPSKDKASKEPKQPKRPSEPKEVGVGGCDGRVWGGVQGMQHTCLGRCLL